MTWRSGTALRRGWVALVAGIVVAGVAVVSLPHPSGSEPRRLPSEFGSLAYEYCYLTSDVALYDNLRITTALRAHRLRVDIALGPAAPDAAAGQAQANEAQRADAATRIQGCLDPYRFDTTTVAIGSDARAMRQYQYDVTVLWPCLRAHHVDPGAMPVPGAVANSDPALDLTSTITKGDHPLPWVLGVAATCPVSPVPARDPATH